MNNKLVSVIITTYHGCDTIARAIESVIKQTYKNIEIIVVDDNGLGSDDQIMTQKIVERYSGVVYIPHKVNINGSAARNTGIKAARGYFIELLDDDDEFLPEKTEKQVTKMIKSGAHVCYTGLKVVFQSGVTRDVISRSEGNIFSDIILRRVEAPTSVLMFTRDAAIRINCFDDSFRRHQDWEFLDRLSYKNNIVCVGEICLIRHIVDRNVAKNMKQYVEQRMYYLKRQEPYISKLSTENQKEFYYNHYSEIMRNYVKSREFISAIKWFFKAGQPLRLISESINKYIGYIRRL